MLTFCCFMIIWNPRSSWSWVPEKVFFYLFYHLALQKTLFLRTSVSKVKAPSTNHHRREAETLSGARVIPTAASRWQVCRWLFHPRALWEASRCRFWAPVCVNLSSMDFSTKNWSIMFLTRVLPKITTASSPLNQFFKANKMSFKKKQNKLSCIS